MHIIMKYMVNKKIIGCIFICLIALSCQHEETINILGYEGTFNLRITIPAMQRVETRGTVTDGMIENLHALVFDQDGNFLSRSEAINMGTAGDYKVILPKTDPDLPAANKKRTVHFIANCDWTGFSDVANQGKSANEIIMSLSTSDKKMAYWRSVTENEGIKEGALSSPIELISNMARISVINETSATSNVVTDMTFAIGDYLDHGTIAPYNQSTQQFDELAVIESTDATRQTIKEADFTNSAGVGGTGSILECYEHLNSKSQQPMYVIIKCIYPGDTNPTYYKIDIVPQGQNTLLDIQRNYHYILHIKEVTARGSLTLAEAIVNPASNNLIYSVLLEKYTSISYGKSALYIETISKTFVQTNQAFTIGFSYYPDIDGAVNNSSVALVVTHEDDTRPAVSSAVLNKPSGLIECKTSSALPAYGHNKSQLIISSTQSGFRLQRVINIYLRKPSKFTNYYIYPNPIPSTANQNVDLHFTIDPDFPSNYYPIEVYITVTKLSPNTDVGYDSKLILDHQVKDRYRYKYTVPNGTEQIVYFKTILNAAPSGTLMLESDLFSPVTIPLTGP